MTGQRDLRWQLAASSVPWPRLLDESAPRPTTILFILLCVADVLPPDCVCMSNTGHSASRHLHLCISWRGPSADYSVTAVAVRGTALGCLRFTSSFKTPTRARASSALLSASCLACPSRSAFDSAACASAAAASAF